MTGSNTTPLTAVFGRLFWMIVGPMALVMTTYFIVTSGNGCAQIDCGELWCNRSGCTMA